MICLHSGSAGGNFAAVEPADQIPRAVDKLS